MRVQATIPTTLERKRTMNMLHENDLLLVAALVATFWFGFVSGKWWALLDKEEMPDNDEELW